MNTSSVRLTRKPRRGEAHGYGSLITRHRGTVFTNGMAWLLGGCFLLLSLTRVLEGIWWLEVLIACLTAASGYVALRDLLQTVELFETHLVWRSGGRARSFAYTEIRDIKAGSWAESTDALRERLHLIIYLHDGSTLRFIDMSRQLELTRELANRLGALVPD